MSGVAPDMPAPPLPTKSALDADSPLEQAYSDALFDYDTVRSNC